ncbi:MAG: hypothetical protein WCG25_08630 [bacterium]
MNHFSHFHNFILFSFFKNIFHVHANGVAAALQLKSKALHKAYFAHPYNICVGYINHFVKP